MFSCDPMRSLFALLLFLLASSLGALAAEPLAGRWEGTLQIPGRELPVVVDLAPEEGGWSGSIIITGLDLKGKPLADITVTDSEASFALAQPAGGRGLEAKFKGKLSEDGRFAGDFIEAGNTAPFVLEKSGPAQVELPPRSTAVSPGLEGTWKGDYEMNGYPRHVTLQLTNHGKEGATAEFVIVGKQTNKIPVELVTQDGETLGIDSNAIGLHFEGRLSQGGGEIKGRSRGCLRRPWSCERRDEFEEKSRRDSLPNESMVRQLRFRRSDVPRRSDPFRRLCRAGPAPVSSRKMDLPDGRSCRLFLGPG